MIGDDYGAIIATVHDVGGPIQPETGLGFLEFAIQLIGCLVTFHAALLENGQNFFLEVNDLTQDMCAEKEC